MKKNPKTTTKKTTEKAIAEKACEKACKEAVQCQYQSVTAHENEIIVKSVLVTSLLVNLFFLVGWVLIASSTDYAQAVGRVIYNM